MAIDMILGSVGIGIVLLFGCVGEIITEKGGNLNLGIPGIMCMGTAGGCLAIVLSMQGLSNIKDVNYAVVVLAGIAGAIVCAAIGGLIYAVLTVTLRANQNVTGLALTIFGSGVSQFIMNTMNAKISNAKACLSVASIRFRTSLPFATDLGWFGEIFLNHGLLVYLAIIVAIICAIFLRKSKTGLKLRAVGENPATADAVGINISGYKYGAIIIGAAIAGLGGLFYVIDNNGGTFDNTSTIQAFGWLAIALVIFTMWKPDLAILGAFIFGFLYIFGYKVTGLTSLSQKELIKLLPYFITIVVLIITSIVGKKNVQPPASLGVNYFREDR